MPPTRENGDLAINHPPIFLAAASPVANRRVWSGCKLLEEEVIIELTNNGRMGEKSPNSSIVVCGRVGVVGGVGGTKGRRRASRTMLGVNTAISCGGGV